MIIRNSLQLPPAESSAARHRRPAVIVHGTILEKESIEQYKDYALDHGHPVDHRTYEGVRDGAKLQLSAREVSNNVNEARRQLAEENMKTLETADAKEFFHIDGDLYGQHDKGAEALAGQIPWFLGKVKDVLKLKPETLEKSFSSRLKSIEEELAERLAEKTDWSAETRQKVAADMVDCVAPKALLIGHSAGGFVAYAMTVNPPEPGQKADEFHYDGANGVGEVILLSSPVGKGLTEPTPPAMADMPFYQVDSQLLRPFEAMPLTQFARLNPFVDFTYRLAKDASKAAFGVAASMTTGLCLPLIYALKPGYEQVTGGSEFFQTYVQDRPIPAGVSVLAVTSKDDRLCEADRSKVDDSQPNGHNLDLDQHISKEELERERPSWAHLKMGEHPAELMEEFRMNLIRNPEGAARYLLPANDDGGRFEVLQDLQTAIQHKPGLLKGPLLDAIRKVAAEKLPFTDSPSALAQQILDR